MLMNKRRLGQQTAPFFRLAGSVVQQAQQSNHLAEGLNHRKLNFS